MARLALLTLAMLAAGCPSAESDDYPIGGGGGGGGPGGPKTDAGTGDGGLTDGQTAIHGRVCLLTDLRQFVNPMVCAATGAGGLSVSLGGSMPVLTGADGSFTIAAQDASNILWRVTGMNLVT